ncbi:PAP2 superfamily protein [Trichomonas vaginalis G3]|uniref:PAP2 superfamily protein n=1 Tax=Trichomonas vaginalis (strain ATCC PRA-98 / G3) TaxID=412133 RepID=A2F6F1_TRIV3|nr:phosphatidate phosphatase protein [Trichomonas vaginalis G3]EAX99509.1 PAP2 superfamily protein [Trichomonas vaginalis G3]KAI5535643.1 phosphatidate phosphatase protein [Trichomonas vaginalis G3]|eukprot:XP_001312439.1 PAP2 superfamily protein [Trichomonas vaginalis G3]
MQKSWYTYYDIPHLILAVVTLLMALGTSFMKPDPLFIPNNDSNSQFPHLGKNTVPTWFAIVLVVVIGLVTFIGFYIFTLKFPDHIRKFNIFSAIFNFFAVLGISTTIVNILKNFVGRARPDMYSLCGNFVGEEYSSCTADVSRKVFDDNYRSWPSGHSAAALSGFMFLALFVQRVMKFSKSLGTFFAALYILLALYIGATRIRDFKHHPDDVLAGFFCGYIISRLVWEQCRKSLFKNIDNKVEAEREPDNEDDQALNNQEPKP